MIGILKKLLGIDDDRLMQALREGAFLVDVRSRAEFAEGSVQDCINIPMDEVPDHLPEFEHEKNIIVFCRSGHRSDQVKKFLEQQGLTNVLNGGSWQNVSALLTQASR